MTRELSAEPPAKSHEARNWALFGSFHLSPADNYQFWRLQSPFWVYPLAGFFKAFGVDYPQLRIFSSLYSALGFATLMWLEAREQRKWLLATTVFGVVLLIACALYTTNPAYSRALAYNVATHLEGVEAYSGRIIGTGRSFAERPFEPNRYRQMLVTMPLTAPLAFCTALGIAIVSVRRRRIELAQVVVALWFVGAWGAVMALAQTGFRYWSLVVPPAAPRLRSAPKPRSTG